VRVEHDHFILERLRETTTIDGRHNAERDLVELDRLSAGRVEWEASQAGFTPSARMSIPATEDYAGSTVLVLHA
jgi:hypothetical protein